MKKVAVFLLPGSNCEQEMIIALKAVGLDPYLVHYSDRCNPARFDAYVFVGGFSYEDRIRAGVIAAHLPLVQKIKREACKGKPILGVCNGAQVLVEAGFIDNGKREVALGPNICKRGRKLSHRGFYCGWVRLKKEEETVFTRCWDESSICYLPVAHIEGRFIVTRRFSRKHHALTYADNRGLKARDFPQNPNGSMFSLAGVCNHLGNVLAMMPHPERACFYHQLPSSLKKIYAPGHDRSAYGDGPGMTFFKSMKLWLN